MTDIVHLFGPQKYSHQTGAVQMLSEYIEDKQITRALVVHGYQSWKAIEPFWPENELKNKYTKIPFSGECSYEERDRIYETVIENQHEVLIGVGGGKVLDTAKAAADKAGIPIILIPTLPSNCACFTPLSIMYSSEGKHLGTIRHSQANNLVLVEPELLVNAPIQHLTSGVGDTLAKWYESKIRFNKLKPDEISLLLEWSHQAAKQCRDNIINFGEAAYQAAESKSSNRNYSRIIDTIFAVSGSVGGLGGKFGRSVGAHAFNYGYVGLGKNAHLHGSVVAYGVLFQLYLEKQFTEIEKLIPIYKRLKLPLSWNELRITPEDGDLEKLSEIILAPTSRIYELPINLTKEKVIDSLRKLEEFVHEKEVKENAV